MAGKLIFCCPQMIKLAVSVAKKDASFKVGAINWGKFADGYPEPFIEDIEAVKNSDVYFFASFDKPDEIFRQYGVIRAFPRYGAKSLTIILPFFPTATMERIDRPGQIATAKTLASILENIPHCSGSGPAKILFVDEHAQDLRFFFNDNIIPEPLSAMSLAIEQLKILKDVEVVFPDAGAHKRFGKYFKDFSQIICDKVRGKKGKRKVVIKEGDPAGKFVVIIDDLTRSGGTLIQCHKALIKAGANYVSAFVTHAPFDGRKWEKFVRDNNNVGFDRTKHFVHFWTTDSCPAKTERLANCRPFEVLSLTNLIYDAIKE